MQDYAYGQKQASLEKINSAGASLSHIFEGK